MKHKRIEHAIPTHLLLLESLLPVPLVCSNHLPLLLLLPSSPFSCSNPYSSAFNVVPICSSNSSDNQPPFVSSISAFNRDHNNDNNNNSNNNCHHDNNNNSTTSLQLLRSCSVPYSARSRFTHKLAILDLQLLLLFVLVLHLFLAVISFPSCSRVFSVSINNTTTTSTAKITPLPRSSPPVLFCLFCSSRLPILSAKISSTTLPRLPQSKSSSALTRVPFSRSPAVFTSLLYSILDSPQLFFAPILPLDLSILPAHSRCLPLILLFFLLLWLSLFISP